MRHSWQRFQFSMSVCCHCGCVRRVDKPKTQARVRIPIVTYVTNQGSEPYAPSCLHDWPVDWRIDLRAVYFKKPAFQLSLNL